MRRNTNIQEAQHHCNGTNAVTGSSFSLVGSAVVLAFALLGHHAQGQEMAAPSDAGDECDLVTTEMVCDNLVTGKCEPQPVCHDSSSDTYGTVQGDGEYALLDVNCDYIQGEDEANDIYIGAKFIYRSGVWQNTGLFAYCMNGAMTTCETVDDPLPVKGNRYSDVMGTTGTLRVCVANSTAIGPWSYLTEYQSTRLELYGCQNVDALRGSPNGDKLIGGGNSDTLYGLEGADVICGDYTTGAVIPICQSGANCSFTDTEAAGGDTATGGDGVDAMYGLGGGDYLWGGRGCDYVSGLEGSDHLYLYVDSSTSDQCDTYNEAHGGDGADYIYAAKDSSNRMWGDGANDYILGSNGMDWLCGGNGVYDSLDGKGGDDIVVDCLGLGETMDENIGDCDHSIYGNTDKDTVCYKKVGTVNVTFCVNGGSGTQDKCYCDPDAGDHCNEVDCEFDADLADCSANGSFSCNCT